ncbi:hypothetical protein J6590_032866 [Homalodisca vitripennis]|nr:hypothetical protein J6590_032866 [Homalodisca vitripennis]
MNICIGRHSKVSNSLSSTNISCATTSESRKNSMFVFLWRKNGERFSCMSEDFQEYHQHQCLFHTSRRCQNMNPTYPQMKSAVPEEIFRIVPPQLGGEIDPRHADYRVRVVADDKWTRPIVEEMLD